MELVASLGADDVVDYTVEDIYPFGKLPDAVRYQEQGRATGKVVVEL